MAEDLIRYDIVIQDALRGAVKKILSEAARVGVPGEHHFYIAFETTAPGVRISQRLKERYPNEMTVVLQHQFWDLTVTDHTFEVGLSFGGVPERLLIPFSAIKGFFDPSVQFALEFDPSKTAEELPDDLRDAGAATQDTVKVVEEINQNLSDAAERTSQASGKDKSADDTKPESSADETPADGDSSGADVVSLDAFRKKP